LALAVKEHLIDRMLATEDRYAQTSAKRLYYLSMEFLIGRSLEMNLHNLGMFDLGHQALKEIGYCLDTVIDHEEDAALGNGGLGRLAACFLESLATLSMPGYGYGINYEFGLFRQEIKNGYQHEKPDNWRAAGNPWEIERPDEACLVPVYGRIDHAKDRDGQYNPMWLDWKMLVGVPHDIPVVGYGGNTVNYLRLYSARSSNDFDMQIFNGGDYINAVKQKIASETISKVLYPSDSVDAGRELRLVQEYFLVACALRDIVRRYLKTHASFDAFPDQVAVQLNDTHPALGIAELMRILVDENEIAWDCAWEITRASFSFTNHTLLPEALEKWPVALLEHVLPRHLQIIYEINDRFLAQVKQRWADDPERLERLSIIEEGAENQVRMAHLAIVGSHAVNGVSALHTELIKSDLIPDFHQLWPKQINNKTNGVTQRRWLLQANPSLAALIREHLGDAWITDLGCLRELEAHLNDETFCARFTAAKRSNKERLAEVIYQTNQVEINIDSLFDVQIKRIHEYKRQLLCVMNIVHEYLDLVENGRTPVVPRTYIFAGKAAPGYWIAKQIIKLINSVARVVNNDAAAEQHLKVVFIPDYRVSLAEKIIPAADLSEQISLAGKEASGTGNMKFGLNGALTIGTLDGANIEILEEVGRDNIFIFGLDRDQVKQMRQEGSYDPTAFYNANPYIRRVVDAFNSNLFCRREPGLFEWLFNALMHDGDEYFLLADFESYTATQRQAGETFKDQPSWTRKAILNVARLGKFSSDRAIAEYADEIWHIKAVK